MAIIRRKGLLLVANWDSGVGYAWWLMESFWVALARHYHPAHSVHLAYPSISEIPAGIRRAPIACHHIDFAPASVAAVWRQCRFLRSHRIRTIYFSDRPTRHLSYLAFRLAGVRCIMVHNHTLGPSPFLSRMKRWAKRALHRIPGYAADGLFGVSDLVRERHIRFTCAPPRRCFTVPNGLPPPPAETPRDVHAEFGIARDRRIMITTCRATRAKGIDFSIRAVAKLVHQQGRRDIHYLFCGDGPDLKEFADLVRELNVDNHVTLAGRRNDVPALLPACAFAIHPSHAEVGFSLSILEYMRAALPVIVPDIASVCGATTHGTDGLIYRADDIDDLCRSITMLLDDEELRARLGKAGKEVVATRYTLATTHAALLKAVAIVDKQAATTPRVSRRHPEAEDSVL